MAYLCRLGKAAPIALVLVLAAAPCFAPAFLCGVKDFEGLVAFEANGVFVEHALFLEGVDAIAGSEGVASEALLDKVANADDAVGGNVVERLALTLMNVDAVAGVVAPGGLLWL